MRISWEFFPNEDTATVHVDRSLPQIIRGDPFETIGQSDEFIECPTCEKSSQRKVWAEIWRGDIGPEREA